MACLWPGSDQTMQEDTVMQAPNTPAAHLSVPPALTSVMGAVLWTMCAPCRTYGMRDRDGVDAHGVTFQIESLPIPDGSSRLALLAW